METVFDSSVSTSWGFLSCNKCASKYPIRSLPIHLPDCPINGSNSSNGDVVYHYGMNEVIRVMKEPSGRSPFGMLRRSDLEAVFDKLPEQVKVTMANLGYAGR